MAAEQAAPQHLCTGGTPQCYSWHHLCTGGTPSVLQSASFVYWWHPSVLRSAAFVYWWHPLSVTVGIMESWRGWQDQDSASQHVGSHRKWSPRIRKVSSWYPCLLGTLVLFSRRLNGVSSESPLGTCEACSGSKVGPLGFRHIFGTDTFLG